jgi:hypothetical protein
VKLYCIDERRSTLPASVQVSGLPATLAAAAVAHVARVGHTAVRPALPDATVAAVRAQQIQMQGQSTRVRGTSGFDAQDNVTAQQPVVGVRGAPPRGRPV